MIKNDKNRILIVTLILTILCGLNWRKMSFDEGFEISLSGLLQIPIAQAEHPWANNPVWVEPEEGFKESVSADECPLRVLQQQPVFHLGCGCYQPNTYCVCGPGFC